MQQLDRVTALADEAARLLPGAPDDGDIEGYLAWRELVWSTAARLGALAGPALPAPSAGSVDAGVDGPLTGASLLDLAALIAAASAPATDAPTGVPFPR